LSYAEYSRAIHKQENEPPKQSWQEQQQFRTINQSVTNLNDTKPVTSFADLSKQLQAPEGEFGADVTNRQNLHSYNNSVNPSGRDQLTTLERGNEDIREKLARYKREREELDKIRQKFSQN
jgi:hypothetical protein